jgi:hypothetical protein
MSRVLSNRRRFAILKHIARQPSRPCVDLPWRLPHQRGDALPSSERTGIGRPRRGMPDVGCRWPVKPRAHLTNPPVYPHVRVLRTATGIRHPFAIMSRLAGKVAGVTGDSKGIGAAIAEPLAAEGASVVVNFASSQSGADEVDASRTDAGCSLSLGCRMLAFARHQTSGIRL